MFRKGGSAAEGTGITSGLRKKYQVGGFSLEGYPYDMEVEEDENLGMNLSATANADKNADVINPNMDATREIYARKFGQNLERQMMPTYRDQILDFLTAFGFKTFITFFFSYENINPIVCLYSPLQHLDILA